MSFDEIFDHTAGAMYDVFDVFKSFSLDSSLPGTYVVCVCCYFTRMMWGVRGDRSLSSCCIPIIVGYSDSKHDSTTICDARYQVLSKCMTLNPLLPAKRCMKQVRRRKLMGGGVREGGLSTAQSTTVTMQQEILHTVV